MMVVYELTHMFFRHDGELVYSPKNLGLYNSYESVKRAMKYYSVQPGFCENPDTFSARERNILGNVIDGTVFEAMLYLHSEDFELESEIELGLYGDETMAQEKLMTYCAENKPLMTVKGLISEKIVNKCIIGKMEWPEGFSISE